MRVRKPRYKEGGAKMIRPHTSSINEDASMQLFPYSYRSQKVIAVGAFQSNKHTAIVL